MIDMSRDLRTYSRMCSVSNHVSLSQIRCHPDDTSDRNLRLTQFCRLRHDPGLGSLVTSSVGTRRDRPAVRIKAVAAYPVGLGPPPRTRAMKL